MTLQKITKITKITVFAQTWWFFNRFHLFQLGSLWFVIFLSNEFTMVLQWFSKKVLLVGYTYIVSSFYNSFTPPAPPPPSSPMVKNGSGMVYHNGSFLLFEGSKWFPDGLLWWFFVAVWRFWFHAFYLSLPPHHGAQWFQDGLLYWFVAVSGFWFHAFYLSLPPPTHGSNCCGMVYYNGSLLLFKGSGSTPSIWLASSGTTVSTWPRRHSG